MPLGFGSTTQLPQLSSLEVSTIPTTRASGGITGFLRILLTIAEIGVAFIPGIDVIGETLVGFAAGAANEGLDISEGNANVASSFLNLASPFVGGAFAGGRNISKFGKLLGETSEISKGGFGILQTEQFGARVLNEANESVSTLSRFNKGIRGFEGRGLEFASEKLGVTRLDVVSDIIGGKTSSIVSGNIGYKLSDNLIREGIDDERFNKFLNKTGLSSARQLELKNLLRQAGTIDNQRSILLGFIRDLGARDALRMYRAVSGEIENLALNEAWQLPLAREMVASYDTAIETHIWTQYGAYSKIPGTRAATSTWGKWKVIWQDKSMPFYKRLSKIIGSSEFDEKIVQRVQALVDPNDAGRAGVEALYRKLKGKLGDYFADAKKLLKGAEKIEDAFVASGGKLVDSDWHMGYKVVKDLGINKQLVMIQFKAEETNGKRPVFVFATDKELERYILSPGRTYLRLWSYSRGGKSLGLGKLFGATSIFKMGKQAASVLGFIPVQALKNVLSLVSNIVENGADINNGTYFNTYEQKFVKSLVNTSISRTFRLAGRVVGGGVATKYFGKAVGDFVGRELQRIGTTYLAAGLKNIIAGNSFNKGASNALITGALVSVRGNALRKLRNHNPNSVIVNTLSARRKLYQIKRIPNAFIPGRPFKGIKL